MKNLTNLRNSILTGKSMIFASSLIGMLFLQSCSKEELTPTSSNINSTSLATNKPASTTGKDFTASNGIGRTSGTKDVKAPVLKLKLFIQGFYKADGSQTMNSSLERTPELADNVTVELHSSLAEHTLVATASGAINIKGIGEFQFPGLDLAQRYFIVVRHRSALETWSAKPITMEMNTSYDFTDAKSKAFGDNQVDFGDGNVGFYSGDIGDANTGREGQDGVIESLDYSMMENAIRSIFTGYVTEDITGDGVVESDDYSIMENNIQSIIYAMRPPAVDL